MYFLVRRGQGIVWIPASLAVLAFLSAAGPWGAFAVAQRSQLAQLRTISAQYKLLKNGKLNGAGQRVPHLPLAARQRITSIFEFFAERDAVAQLAPFFTGRFQLPDSLRRENKWLRNNWQTERLFALSGIDQASRYDTDNEQLSAYFYTSERGASYDLGSGRYWLKDINSQEYSPTQSSGVLAEITAREGTFRIRSAAQGRLLLVQQELALRGWQTQLTLSPGALADSLARTYGRNPEHSVEMPRSITLTALPRR